MKYWKEYEGHAFSIVGKRNKFDGTIYTFDIETSSYFILNGKQYPANDYLKFSKEEQEQCIFMSNMYIWMFSIEKTVYYGRTWSELKAFIERLEYYTDNNQKFVFVHNLSYEFQYLRNIFKFKNVFSRKSRKVMKCELEDYNIEFRCSYYMTGLKLEKVADVYELDIKKLVGNLDYTKIRHSETKLTEKELAYCENDCLVVREYIFYELARYKTVKNIPITATGHVRREFRELIEKNFVYKDKVRKSVNIDGHVFNLLTKAFAGGYTHANWTKSGTIIKNVTSFDFTSSYPYVMLTEKYPMSEFRKCNLTKFEQLTDNFCYIIHVKFKNIKCKYYNNFISQNKCESILKGRYDNGRVISADELEIVLTDVDLKIIRQAYKFEEYEIIEIYWAYKRYLPKEFLEFILEKYENKTKYKNVEGKEVIYALAKADFNALYGMSVTNEIRDLVSFDNINWTETPLTNEQIIKSLINQKKNAFMSYSWRSIYNCIC